MFTPQSATPFAFVGQTIPQSQQQFLFSQPTPQISPFGQNSFPAQVESNMMDTATPTPQIVPFNWAGLPQAQNQQQQQPFQPFFNPNQSFQFQQQQPPPQNLSFFPQPQPQQQLFQIQPMPQQQPVPVQTPIFGQPPQPQQQQFFVMSQPQCQSQYQFGPPQQQLYCLQPVPQPQQQQQQPSLVSFPSPVQSAWGSSDASLPEKFMRNSLLLPREGRGPSTLTPDPVFQSPLFHWGRNPATGDPCAIGLNSDLLPILMKCPGEEVADRGRRVKSLERLELDTLRAQVKLLSENLGHYSFSPSTRGFKPPPPLMGLFDQESIPCHLRDEWNNWQERRRREQRLGVGSAGSDRTTPRGPPKYNDGIDPILGTTVLERYDSPHQDRKWNMRPLDGRSRRGTTVDTIFDVPLNSSDIQTTQSQTKSLFHNHRFIGNPSAPTHLPSPMKYCPNGLLRLGPRVTQDLAPRYRAPVRIGSNGLPVKKPGDECGVKLTRPYYFCKPDLATLDIIKNSVTGQTLVSDFLVGHVTHGEIKFPGEVDVTGLNLDETVEFSHKEAILYPDSAMKPPYGQELNRRAIVTLKNVWPKCKNTGMDIRDCDKIKELNYERVLLKSCARFNGKFLSYNSISGVWVFEIQHVR